MKRLLHGLKMKRKLKNLKDLILGAIRVFGAPRAN
jgi:hypothetical protein